jgi:hypothetical protein
MPGVGYADRPKELFSSWGVTLRNYSATRRSLRALFHLVDSRHGLLEADSQCLDLLATLPKYVKYFIVLTKIDKLSSCVERNNLYSQLRRDLSTIIRERCGGSDNESTIINEHNNEEPHLFAEKKVFDSRTPIIIETSSAHKKGGTSLWAHVLNSISA